MSSTAGIEMTTLVPVDMPASIVGWAGGVMAVLKEPKHITVTLTPPSPLYGLYVFCTNLHFRATQLPTKNHANRPTISLFRV